MKGERIKGERIKGERIGTFLLPARRPAKNSLCLLCKNYDMIGAPSYRGKLMRGWVVS